MTTCKRCGLTMTPAATRFARLAHARRRELPLDEKYRPFQHAFPYATGEDAHPDRSCVHALIVALKDAKKSRPPD